MQHYYNSGNDEKVSEMQNQLTGNLKMLTTDFATPWMSILSGVLEMFISIGMMCIRDRSRTVLFSSKIALCVCARKRNQCIFRSTPARCV